jgi:hypothetical protein
MMRHGLMVMAMSLGIAVSASSLAGQERKLIAPVRGEATVEITPPATKLGDEVVTTIRLRNTAKGPIAGLRVEETWFKGNEALSGDIYRHPRPVQVGEVIEIRLVVPRARVTGARDPRYRFSHANGDIKTAVVKTLPAPTASKPATTATATPPKKG